MLIARLKFKIKQTLETVILSHTLRNYVSKEAGRDSPCLHDNNEGHYALKPFSEREAKPKENRELHKDSGRMEISKTGTKKIKSTDY